MSLRAFLDLVERGGNTVMLARAIDRVVDAEAREALAAAGAIASAPPAHTWACGDDRPDCAREVRANRAGAKKALVAVCGCAPPACEPVELGTDDVARRALRVEALVAAACALLGAEVDPSAPARVRKRGARAPVRVAMRDERDVFWAGAPRDQAIDPFLALRERAERATLLLVPTSKHVPGDLATRHAPGERVEVRALADLLVVREGALALARAVGQHLRLAKTPAAAPNAPLAVVLGARRFEDVTARVVDPHTVRFACGARHVTKTFAELGFVDRRAKEEKPVKAWPVFVALCKEGHFRPSEYGAFGRAFAVKKAIETLTRTLQAAFGLDQDPLLPYTTHRGWQPRFRTESPRWR